MAHETKSEFFHGLYEIRSDFLLFACTKVNRNYFLCCTNLHRNSRWLMHEIKSEYVRITAQTHVGIFCKAFVDPAGRMEVTLHEIKSAFFGLHDIESEFYK